MTSHDRDRLRGWLRDLVSVHSELHEIEKRIENIRAGLGELYIRAVEKIDEGTCDGQH